MLIRQLGDDRREAAEAATDLERLRVALACKQTADVRWLRAFLAIFKIRTYAARLKTLPR